MSSHTNAINLTTPADSDGAGASLGQGSRDDKLDIKERMELDHVWANEQDQEKQDADGYHKKVTLAPVASTPTKLTDGDAVEGVHYTKAVEYNINSTDSGATATTSGTGYRTVTLSAGVLDYTNMSTPNYYQIKFGTDSLTGTGSPDEWYTIATVDSATQVTISNAESPTSQSEVSFVIGTLSGDENTEAFYRDSNENEVQITKNGKLFGSGITITTSSIPDNSITSDKIKYTDVLPDIDDVVISSSAISRSGSGYSYSSTLKTLTVESGQQYMIRGGGKLKSSSSSAWIMGGIYASGDPLVIDYNGFSTSQGLYSACYDTSYCYYDFPPLIISADDSGDIEIKVMVYSPGSQTGYLDDYFIHVTRIA